MKRILIGLGIVVAIVIIVFAVARERIALSVMERVVAQRMLTNSLGELPDGLHVALCGAGSPMPDADRSGPCTAVMAGDTLLVFDAGTGSSRQFAFMALPLGQIEAVFLTHFHSDHIDGLGELMMQRWVNGAHTTPLPVYGPPGTEKVVDGFNLAYQQDAVYRVAHHGAKTVPPGGEGGKAEVFGRISPLAMEVVYAKGDDLTVEAFNVEHSPIEPAIGYKVTYKDRSIVISGDTIKSAMVQKASQGVDVLIHEALSHELVMILSDAAAEAGRDNLVKITKDILDYHTSPVEAAELAQSAGVGMLLFSHIVPPLPVAPLKGVFLRGVSDAYDGPVVIGEDGTFVSLPAGSDVIETGNLK